jgi:hypothetical protein
LAAAGCTSALSTGATTPDGSQWLVAILLDEISLWALPALPLLRALLTHAEHQRESRGLRSPYRRKVKEAISPVRCDRINWAASAAETGLSSAVRGRRQCGR